MLTITLGRGIWPAFIVVPAGLSHSIDTADTGIRLEDAEGRCSEAGVLRWDGQEVSSMEEPVGGEAASPQKFAGRFWARKWCSTRPEDPSNLNYARGRQT